MICNNVNVEIFNTFKVCSYICCSTNVCDRGLHDSNFTGSWCKLSFRQTSIFQQTYNCRLSFRALKWARHLSLTASSAFKTFRRLHYTAQNYCMLFDGFQDLFFWYSLLKLTAHETYWAGISKWFISRLSECIDPFDYSSPASDSHSEEDFCCLYNLSFLLNHLNLLGKDGKHSWMPTLYTVPR